MPTLRAVIFDLDGVITDTAECHYQGWKRLADELGVAFDRQQNERLRGIGRLESLEMVLENSSRHFSQSEKLELASRKNQYYLEQVARITPGDILNGIPQLLREISANGVKMAVASASKNASEVITKLKLAEEFDAIVDGTCVTKGKPDPELFLKASAKLQESPQDCVGVEDAAAGIEAIRAAGMVAIGIGPKERVQAAHAFVDSPARLTLGFIREVFRKAHE